MIIDHIKTNIYKWSFFDNNLYIKNNNDAGERKLWFLDCI